MVGFVSVCLPYLNAVPTAWTVLGERENERDLPMYCRFSWCCRFCLSFTEWSTAPNSIRYWPDGNVCLCVCVVNVCELFLETKQRVHMLEKDSCSNDVVGMICLQFDEKCRPTNFMRVVQFRLRSNRWRSTPCFSAFCSSKCLWFHNHWTVTFVYWFWSDKVRN